MFEWFFCMYVCMYTKSMPGTQRIKKIVSYLRRLSGAKDHGELSSGY